MKGSRGSKVNKRQGEEGEQQSKSDPAQTEQGAIAQPDKAPADQTTPQNQQTDNSQTGQVGGTPVSAQGQSIPPPADPLSPPTAASTAQPANTVQQSDTGKQAEVIGQGGETSVSPPIVLHDPGQEGDKALAKTNQDVRIGATLIAKQ